MKPSFLPAAVLTAGFAALNVGGLAWAQETCGRIADVPEAVIRFPEPRSVRLKLSSNLVQSFFDGGGHLNPAPRTSPLTLAERVQLDPLPWDIAEGRQDNARLMVWQDKTGSNDDNMPAMVLRDGESWCSEGHDFPKGSRLRFEGVSVERNAAATRLSVTVKRKDSAASLSETTLPSPGKLTAARQADLSLEGGPGQICFRATGGAAAIGEARVLAPEPAGSDARPRWVVLTIEDDLRGDFLRAGNEQGSRMVPTLTALAKEGRTFERAISPGCHTSASVWPILMGRDLMRIDPLMRRQSLPNRSPLGDVYSRGNRFISHLAEAAGYRSVFLGNNAYFRRIPGFGRMSSWGTTDRGTFDTIQALPDLFGRYADERVLLVYYVTAPHSHAQTPRRLFEALGCPQLRGTDLCRCNYRARVRHADEALEHLQKGLSAAGLDRDTFQVITADHGELFDDGLPLEGEIRTGRETGLKNALFESFEMAHGRGCSARESDVPLVVHGRGVAPAVSTEPVSGLDIFPTLLEVLKAPTTSQLDGTPLPLTKAGTKADRRFVSYGFCSDSMIRGNEQMIWWLQGCQVRERGSLSPLPYRSELWSGAKRVATDKDQPARLHRAMSEHETWLRERLPGEALVFGLDHAGPSATLTVEVQDGVITDYGPSGSAFGLERIAITTTNPKRLSVRFDGYEGLYYVSTLPPRAAVRLSLLLDGKPVKPVTLVGPMQIPLDTDGRWINPGERPTFFISSDAPRRRPTVRPTLRLWWQRYGAPGTTDNPLAISEFDRVLREWGYIR